MKNKNLIIYQTDDGAIELQGDINKDTLWANQEQIAKIFGVNRPAVAKHIRNIFKDKELDKKVVCSNLEHTTQHGMLKGKTQTRKVKYYNLDIILAVGYRVRSSLATKFRQWATKTLKKHIVDGYTINPSRIDKNYKQFLKAVDDVKNLLSSSSKVDTGDALDLVRLFAETWLSLKAYDQSILPNSGLNKKEVKFTSDELLNSIYKLKKDLISKNHTSYLFAQEKTQGSFSGIVGNVFQSVFGEDVYPTIEEKAAHLLYFIIKTHPFNDGNKRSGAFAFVWFLRKADVLDTTRITPEALTALTILIAESNPKDKSKMIGVVLLMLRK